MIENYNAVLFDLDGTLIDSMWMWHSIDVEYLAKFGLDIPDDLQDSIEGMSFSETAVYFKERFNIPDSLENIKNDWNNMARDIYLTRVPLKNGVMEFLDFLKAKDFKLAICTSNSEELARSVTDVLGITNYFDTIITACMVGAGKPNPDIYLKAASDCNVPVNKCLVFEDVTQGILAGKNAGMLTIAVEDMYSIDKKEEKKAVADLYIKDFNEFMEKFC